MLTPGSYALRDGRMARVYEIVWSLAHGCHIATGALFTNRGTFLSVEFWRASDGHYHVATDRIGPNDIDASFSALPTTNRNAA